MRKLFTLALTILAGAGFLLQQTWADESLTDKVQNTGTDMKRDTKKGVRKMKRKARKAAGKDTVGKDIKDGVNDLGDNIDAGVTKAKRKAE